MNSLPYSKALRNPILAMLLICCSLSACIRPVSTNHKQKPQPSPNIIFLLTDDHRWDELGIHEHPVLKTPNLDQLAKEGIYFENAYVGSAICTPSRASIFLGQYERKHGINFNSGTSMSPEAWAKSYPSLLKEADYFLGYIGKNHVPIGPKGYADTLMASTFDYWYAGHGHLSFYPKKRHKIFKNSQYDTQIEVIGEGVENFFDPQKEFISGTQDFFKKLPENKAFCLSIAFNLPHGAGASTMQQLPTDPPLYRNAYREDSINFSPLYVSKDSIKQPKLPSEILHAQHRQISYSYVDTRKELKERKIRRYQTITGIDRLLGKIRKILEEKGLAENTVLVFTSDHGIMEGEWGLGGKALNYEACLKVPFMVYDPNLPTSSRGIREKGFVQSLDIAPSILSWAGLEIPSSMQGLPLQRLMQGEASDWRTVVFGENLWSNWFGNPRIESVREGNWKYIRYFRNENGIPPKGKAAYAMTEDRAALYQAHRTASIEGEEPIYEELFDLEADPFENDNLADIELYKAKLERMRILCKEMLLEAKGAGEPAVLSYIKR
ncbi:MAG: sulfatase-like hydrolase/transferase [Bacteroidota bacterium]